MSTSYPYLTLSRQLCVRYGMVLRLVDRFDELVLPGRYDGYTDAVLHHVINMGVAGNFPGGEKDVQAVHAAWMAEQKRRRSVLMPLVNTIPFVDDGSTKPFSSRDVLMPPEAK